MKMLENLFKEHKFIMKLCQTRNWIVDFLHYKAEFNVCLIYFRN